MTEETKIKIGGTILLVFIIFLSTIPYVAPIFLAVIFAIVLLEERE